MACTSAGKYDPDTNRYGCQVTGDDCMYMRPDSKQCAEDFNEGPDAKHDDENEGEKES